MASKKNFSITTPRGSVVTEVTANGSVQAKLEWNPSLPDKSREFFESSRVCRFRMPEIYESTHAKENRYDD